MRTKKCPLLSWGVRATFTLIAGLAPLACSPAPIPKVSANRPPEAAQETPAPAPPIVAEQEPTPERPRPDIEALAAALEAVLSGVPADSSPPHEAFEDAPDSGGQTSASFEARLNPNAPGGIELIPLGDAPARAAAPESETAQYYAAVTREISALRADVQRLQEQMDAYVFGAMEELRSENARLRRELEQSYAQRGSRPGAPMPPRPIDGNAEGEPPVGPYDDPLARFRLSQLGQGGAAGAEEAIERADEQAVEDETFELVGIGGDSDTSYAVIKEWGRTAEEAKRLSMGASSMKGMICAVPAGGAQEQLMELGRRLRAEFDSYENINISVFDDFAAARTYADTNRIEKEPVLKISRHQASGIDDITLITNGVPVRVPPQGAPLPGARPRLVPEAAALEPVAETARPDPAAVPPESNDASPVEAPAVIPPDSGKP